MAIPFRYLTGPTPPTTQCAESAVHDYLHSDSRFAFRIPAPFVVYLLLKANRHGAPAIKMSIRWPFLWDNQQIDFKTLLPTFDCRATTSEID